MQTQIQMHKGGGTLCMSGVGGGKKIWFCTDWYSARKNKTRFMGAKLSNIVAFAHTVAEAHWNRQYVHQEGWFSYGPKRRIFKLFT